MLAAAVSNGDPIPASPIYIQNLLLKTKNALNDNREIPSDDSDQENSDVENQIQNVSATKTKNSRI